MTQDTTSEALAAEVKRLANAYAVACVEFEKASVADAVERELRATMLGAEKALHAAIAALSAPAPQVLPPIEKLVGHLAIIEATMTINGKSTLGMAGAEAAYEIFSAALQGAALRSQPPAPSWRPIDVLPASGREVILVALAWRKFGEHEDGTPCETSGVMITEGEYIPRHGDIGGYFMAFASPVGDSGGVTHWMPLPSAPSTEGAA